MFFPARYRENIVIPKTNGPIKIKTNEEKMIENAVESCTFKSVMACVMGKLTGIFNIKQNFVCFIIPKATVWVLPLVYLVPPSIQICRIPLPMKRNKLLGKSSEKWDPPHILMQRILLWLVLCFPRWSVTLKVYVLIAWECWNKFLIFKAILYLIIVRLLPCVYGRNR